MRNFGCIGNEKNLHLCEKMEASIKARIERFLDRQHIALAGYSRNTRKFGHVVYKTLKAKGYTLYPVNPSGGKATGGEDIYTDLEALPADVKALVVVTRPDITTGIVEKAIDNGFEHIWIQQMSGSKQLYEQLGQKEVNVVCGNCILLHAQPTGIHKFHRCLLGLVGRLPK